ncbi:MAG: hypothetical protein K6G26_09325, partial [Lachnospiraceae bacterium]|nr:hypothetical protein [Lachnospiraceae bacterium]
IIVPSFSKGEQDFINLLSNYIKYDTTVVWGNCCGAIKSPQKGIGGCAIAGSCCIELFGDVCKCNNNCKNIGACIFTIDLPIGQPVIKLKGQNTNKSVKHHIKTNI